MTLDAFAQQPRMALDNAAIAGRVVRQLALKPGERVIIVAHPGMLEPLIPHLRFEVMRAGGVDLGVVLVPPLPARATWDRDVFDKGTRDARAAYKEMFRDVDAAIMMPGATPADAAYGAMQDWLRAGRGRTVHFHWLENGSAYPLPGQPLPAEAAIDAVYQRAVLETDYDALAALQRRFAEAMHGREIRITSPAGTDLRFRIGDRPVNLQDGDASAARAARGKVLVDREIEIPAGVVRVAPIEESVEGAITFPPSQWDARPVEGLKLTFAKGKVTGITASAGREAVDAELTRAGAAGRSFREFALGLNPLLAVPERNPWIPYYGYGAGVVRLSLGDNSELGGAVGGGYVRWNFFTDLTVTVGDTTWVRDGRLTMK
jgi:aminopeptidase